MTTIFVDGRQLTNWLDLTLILNHTKLSVNRSQIITIFHGKRYLMEETLQLKKSKEALEEDAVF